ncbi:MAG: hypothetical protein WCG03_02680 [Kiritimatiellales bacterium]
MKKIFFFMCFVSLLSSVAPAWVVNISDYGAYGNGTNDDTTAFNNAVNAVSAAGGGTVRLNAHQQYYLANTPTIKSNVTVEGEWVNVGHYTATTLDDLGSCLLLNPAKKLFMYSGSALKGVMVLNATVKPSVADDSGFSGTALALYGENITVENCAVMGFDIGIWGPAAYDNKDCSLRYLNFDNKNNINIVNSSTGLVMQSIHGLAWLTEGDTNHPLTIREGAAFYLQNVYNSQAINCFAIYSRNGFDIYNCSNNYFKACGIDYSRTNSNGTGWNIRGDSGNIYLLGCQAASMNTGVVVNLSSSSSNVEMRGCEIWNVKKYAVRCLNGTVNIRCSYFRGDGAIWTTLDALCSDGVNATITDVCSSFEYFRYAHYRKSGVLTESSNISANDSHLTAMFFSD